MRLAKVRGSCKDPPDSPFIQSGSSLGKGDAERRGLRLRGGEHCPFLMSMEVEVVAQTFTAVTTATEIGCYVGANHRLGRTSLFNALV